MSASVGSEVPLSRVQPPGPAPVERPLRVCFVSADYPTTSPQGVGGIGAHTYALAHAIADLGHEVSVITQSDNGADTHDDGPVAVHALASGSTRMWKLGHWVPVYWVRRSLAVWRALQRLQAERPFDIVSFADGYGEGCRYSLSPLGPFAVQLFGPASLVQQWDGRSVPPFRARIESWMERRPATGAVTSRRICCSDMAPIRNSASPVRRRTSAGDHNSSCSWCLCGLVRGGRLRGRSRHSRPRSRDHVLHHVSQRAIEDRKPHARQR